MLGLEKLLKSEHLKLVRAMCTKVRFGWFRTTGNVVTIQNNCISYRDGIRTP